MVVRYITEYSSLTRRQKNILKKKCHPENVVRLKGKDLLGRMSYNIISEEIDAANISEEKKEGARQVFLHF